jgi:DNA processing protein
MARALATECARAGIVVVSGLARGIDSQAHRAALDAGGITWAVLGSGIDIIYPRENASMAGDILRSGALASELPLGTPPLAAHFPRRNRIVSGLSFGTVVVEGDLKSGSLITAKCALGQGREVFAFPGPADSPMSEGPLELLRQGAVLVRGLDDVLEELPALVSASAPAASHDSVETERERGLITDERKIFELLSSGDRSLDELIEGTGWNVQLLVRVLSELEGRGLVIATPGQRYARI